MPQCRLISNLSFITKILESLSITESFQADNMIFEQFLVLENIILLRLALLKILNKVLVICDSGNFCS